VVVVGDAQSRGDAVNTAAYQFGHWLFTTAATPLLGSWAVALSRTRWRGGVGLLGRYSLQIYLCHPLVLVSVPVLLAPFGVRYAIVLSLILAVSIPLGFALLAHRLRTSELLFGR
jgi:membrane-bound acyltransferase YfiQ involved in biofilm formation